MSPDKPTLAIGAAGERLKRRRGSDRPGYVSPYRVRHRFLTSILKTDEHAEFSERARSQGLAPTTLATKLLREYLAREVPIIDADDYQDAKLVYGDDA